MKKNAITTISVITWISIVLGVIFIIAGFASFGEGAWSLIAIGAAMLIYSPFMFGFRYIVEAASRYLEKNGSLY